MNKEEILSAFLLANIPEIITQEEFNDVKKAIKQLQQENQELKEENFNLREYINIDKMSVPYKSDSFEELMTMPTYKKLEQQLDLYKSVLDEIREYINNYDVFKEFTFPLMKRDEENQVKSSIDYEFQTSIKKSLLQILDKATEQKW